MRHRRPSLPVALASLVVCLLVSPVVPAQDTGPARQDTSAGADGAPGTAAGATAEAADEAASTGTGDAVVDARLADITVYAGRFPDAFVDELVRYFDAPRPLIEELLREGAPAGDLYYACALARVTGRPCRGVIDTWRRAGGHGWEPIAARFGVEPGSERATRLRDGIAESYAHWGRPLPAD